METSNDTSHSKRFQRWAFGIGIVLVLNLFFNYTLSLVYHQPEYEAFCPRMQDTSQISTKNECIEKGGAWSQYTVPQKADPLGPVINGYCDPTFTCSGLYNTAQKAYDQNVFIALVILGVISLGLGLLFRVNDVVSAGLTYGGVLSFIIASLRYWSSAGDYVKVIILGVALITLVFIAVKKFSSHGGVQS